MFAIFVSGSVVMNFSFNIEAALMLLGVGSIAVNFTSNKFNSDKVGSAIDCVKSNINEKNT